MIRSNRIALGFLAIAACSTDDSTVPTMPPDVAALAVRSPGPWPYMATGGGQDLYPGSTTSDFQIAFQAKEDASGNDVGSVLWTDPTTGTIIQKGLVDCLYVQGNRAWIRYVVNIGADRFHTYIGFEDNGEGQQAAVDRHTYIYGGPFDPTNFTCEFFANTDGFGTGFPVEWIRGNVQVAALAVRSPDPWAHMATGGGQDLYPGSTTSDFQIAFQAKEDASGNDVGSVLWTDPTTGTILQKGLVDCLYVEGNRAWIRYVVNFGADRFHTYIGFEDNGEGLQAAVDRHTYIYGGPFDPTNFTCEFFANTNGFGTGFPVEWTRGNVQVK